MVVKLIHSSPSSAEAKNIGAVPPLPIHLHDVELSYLSTGRTLPLTLLEVYEILGVMLSIYYVFLESSYTLGNFSPGNLCPSSLLICESGFSVLDHSFYLT